MNKIIRTTVAAIVLTVSQNGYSLPRMEDIADITEDQWNRMNKAERRLVQEIAKQGLLESDRHNELKRAEFIDSME